MSLDEALAVLQLERMARENFDEATGKLIAEVLLMREALQFYANRQTWVDGVAVGLDQDDDEGRVARAALHLDDYAGRPLIVLTAREAR